MTWRRFLRDVQASARRAEREASRRRKALLQQNLQQAKMDFAAQVRHVVGLYENQIELVTSVHKDCGPEWDWPAIQNAPLPAAPSLEKMNEEAAERALRIYRPGLIDRLLNRVEAKQARLRAAVTKGRQEDKVRYREAVENYRTARADWEEWHRFAERVLGGDVTAYKELIQESAPFEEINLLGSQIEFTFANKATVQASLAVNGDKVIPQDIISQLKNGKLSKKQMPKTRFSELYQDYVCGCALRVGRELFALLPIKTAVVTAFGDVLNAQTGHLEQTPILSVAIPRATLQRIHWATVDPSDAMSNFIHRMCFKKGKGLFGVDPVQFSEITA
jgi:hypothetical protein